MGIASSSAVLPFGELVLAQDQSLAIWLGRCEATDEHILAKANSSSLVKSMSVTRLSLNSSRDLAMFTSIILPPPELASAAYLKMAKFADQPSEKAGEQESLGWSFHRKLATSIPSRRQKEDTCSSPELCLSGLAQPPLSQACPFELSDLAWQQPDLQQPHELQPTAFAPISCATAGFSNNQHL